MNKENDFLEKRKKIGQYIIYSTLLILTFNFFFQQYVVDGFLLHFILFIYILVFSFGIFIISSPEEIFMLSNFGNKKNNNMIFSVSLIIVFLFPIIYCFLFDEKKIPHSWWYSFCLFLTFFLSIIDRDYCLRFISKEQKLDYIVKKVFYYCNILLIFASCILISFF